MGIYFSIVIPAYNGDDFIISALECIRLQTYKNYEVIVVENGSADNTYKLAYDYQQANPNIDLSIVQVFPNAGISGARNIGIKNAKYDYISFLDVDDYWFPDKLQIVNEMLLRNPGIDVIWHWENTVQHDTNAIVRVNHYKDVGRYNAYKNLLLHGNQLSASAITVKKQVLLDVGGFSPEYVSGEEDYDCWLKIAKTKASFFLIKKVLGEYRLHGSSVSANWERHALSVHKMLMKHVDNIRADNGSSFRIKLIEKSVYARYYYLIGRINSNLGKKKKAFHNFIKSISIMPIAVKPYIAIFYMFIEKHRS